MKERVELKEVWTWERSEHLVENWLSALQACSPGEQLKRVWRWWPTLEKIEYEDLHLRKFVCNEACLPAHVAVAPGGPLHLHPRLVQLLPDVVAKDVPDVLLALQFLSPHLEQLHLGALAGKVEEVVVLQLAKGRWVRLAPTAVREFVPVTSPVDVRLWSLGPKDGPHLLFRDSSWIDVLSGNTHLLCVPGWICRKSEGKGLLDVRPQTKVLQNGRAGHLPVDAE